MIDPKELRIGNLLLRKGKVVAVDGVENATQEHHQCWLIWINYGSAFDIRDFEPIPITSEWLERCGFLEGVKVYHDGSEAHAFILKGQLYIIRQIDLGDGDTFYGMEYFPYKQSHNCIPARIQYVHQLQNLYFALTGEEIKIKELV